MQTQTLNATMKQASW